MILKPVTSEKAVRLIDIENTITFEIPKQAKKPEIRAEVERIFGVKVRGIRTNIQLNKKYAFVRLQASTPAIDVATKLGMI